MFYIFLQNLSFDESQIQKDSNPNQFILEHKRKVPHLPSKTSLNSQDLISMARSSVLQFHVYQVFRYSQLAEQSKISRSCDNNVARSVVETKRGVEDKIFAKGAPTKWR